jgi:hypothetical protein
MFKIQESGPDQNGPSFHNSHALLQRIDVLPKGPEWICATFRITSDELDKNGERCTEDVELWHRDPVECIKELISNSAFEDKLAYSLLRMYEDKQRTNRIYNEMWTCNWVVGHSGTDNNNSVRERTASDSQQDKLPCGATITPVILSSDKTQLSTFSGDKQAWPVYLSIGNIKKSTRRQLTSRAMVLIGYIPMCKLECFSDKNRSVEGYQLFHDCMRTLLEPLIDTGQRGVDMPCADGFIRRVYPILAAYIADYPEQCLVACCRENTCPQCAVPAKKRGEQIHSVLRDPQNTLRTLAEQSHGEKPKK